MSKVVENNNCYYCGNKATGKEHIPPRSFFPDGQRKELFTVPACEEHNNDKSKDDEYVKIVLTTSANLMFRGDLLPIIEKSNKALKRNPKLNSIVKNNPEPAFIELSNEELIESKSHEIDLKRFYSFFDCLGRGLYFHRKQSAWKGRVSIAPHFLLSKHADEVDLKKTKSYLHYSIKMILMA